MYEVIVTADAMMWIMVSALSESGPIMKIICDIQHITVWLGTYFTNRLRS